MQKNQKGFAALGAIVLVVIVFVVIGGGYLVLKNQDKVSVARTESVATSEAKSKITANGTPENATKAVTQQLDTEIMIEDDGAEKEASATQLDASTLSGVQEAVDASKL